MNNSGSISSSSTPTMIVRSTIHEVSTDANLNQSLSITVLGTPTALLVAAGDVIEPLSYRTYLYLIVSFHFSMHYLLLLYFPMFLPHRSTSRLNEDFHTTTGWLVSNGMSPASSLIPICCESTSLDALEGNNLDVLNWRGGEALFERWKGLI